MAGIQVEWVIYIMTNCARANVTLKNAFKDYYSPAENDVFFQLNYIISFVVVKQCRWKNVSIQEKNMRFGKFTTKDHINKTEYGIMRFFIFCAINVKFWKMPEKWLQNA